MLADELSSVLCPFCPDLRFDANRRSGLPAESSVLFRGAFLFVTPDVAPVCEGHLLAVSIDHHLSMGRLAAGVGLERFTAELREILERYERSFDGKPQLFEHGSGSDELRHEVDAVSCGSCIDHAHMHLLPNGTLDEDRLNMLLGSWATLDLDQLAGLEPSLPYVVFGDGYHHRAYLGQPPSRQLLRWIVGDGVLDSGETWQARWGSRRSRKLFMATMRRARHSGAW